MSHALIIDPAAQPLSPHERIIEAARTLFCRDGIHATGIDRILTEAGASKMTLYSRFGSKEALIRVVLEREGEVWRAAFFRDFILATPDPAGPLLSVIPALRQWFEGERFFGCPFMNAAAEHAKGAEGEPWLRDMTAQHHAAILGFLTPLAHQSGYADPAMRARQVLLVLDGAIAALMVSGNPEVLSVAEATLRAVLVAP